MKVLLFITILIVGALASDDESCRAEVIRIRDAIVAHVNDNTFDYMNVYKMMMKLHNGEITEDEFDTFVDGFCPKALDGTKFGLDQIPTISADCVNFPTIVLRKNMLRIFNVVFGKLCAEGGKGYKDVVKNNGTNCFLGNQEYLDCFKAQNMHVLNEEHFKAENVCKFIKVHAECDQLLDTCENHDVKTYQHEINIKMKEALNCTFD